MILMLFEEPWAQVWILVLKSVGFGKVIQADMPLVSFGTRQLLSAVEDVVV